jgi:hypothetical protein
VQTKRTLDHLGFGLVCLSVVLLPPETVNAQRHGATTNRYHVRVVARTGERIDGRKILSLYDPGGTTLRDQPLTLNDDRHIAFIAATDRGQTIFVDRKAIADTGMSLGGFPVVTLGRPALSRTGSMLAYRAVTKECSAILCNYESIVLNGAQVLKTGQDISGCGKIVEISDPQINAAGAYGVVVRTQGFLYPCLLINGSTVVTFAETLDRIEPVLGGGAFPSGITSFIFLDDGSFAYMALGSATPNRPKGNLLCFSRDCRPVSWMPRLPVVNQRRQYIYDPYGKVVTREGRYINGLNALAFAMNDSGQIFTNNWELLTYEAATVKPLSWTRATPYLHPRPLNQRNLASTLCPLEHVACEKQCDSLMVAASRSIGAGTLRHSFITTIITIGCTKRSSSASRADPSALPQQAARPPSLTQCRSPLRRGRLRSNIPRI